MDSSPTAQKTLASKARLAHNERNRPLCHVLLVVCTLPNVDEVLDMPRLRHIASVMTLSLLLVQSLTLAQAAPKRAASANAKVNETLVVGVIAESAMTPRTVTVGSEFQGTLVTETTAGKPIGGALSGLPEGTQFIGHVSKAENSHLSQETKTTQVTKVTIQVDKLILPNGKVLPFLDPIPSRAHSELKLSWADQPNPKMVQANQPPQTAMACQRMPKGALYPGDLVYLRLDRDALSQTLQEKPNNSAVTP